MKKQATDIDNDLRELWGGSINIPSEQEEHEEFSEYISTFHGSGQYQWPVQVSPNSKSPALIQSGDNWQSIDENKKPWIIGTFIPGKNINPMHPHGHDGVDLVAPRGTPIYPIAPGTVTRVSSSDTGKGGITAHIEHENGHVVSYYAHMDNLNVSPGQEVDYNTIIGTVGDSGNAKGTSTHLHFTIKVDNRLKDPQAVIGKTVGSLAKSANIRKLFDKIARSKIK
jgi:murein DD-endopeptidase MepM/ murein hydrolase activator NlpD